MEYILKIFKQNYKQILLVYLICSVANLLFIIEPYILGKMIDGLIKHNYIPLIYFVVVQIGFITFGLIRRVWDTKIFTKIQNNIILNFLKNNKCVDESATNARVEMTKEVVGFLENEIPSYIYGVYTIVGSLLFIFNINLIVGLILLLFLVPSILFFKYYYNKNKRVIKLINSNHEDQINKLKTNNLTIITDYLNRKRKLRIFESTLNGKNFAVFDSLINVFLLGSMIIYIILGDISIGQSLAFYTYVRNYLGSTLILSFAMSTYASLNDIGVRLSQIDG